MHDLDNDDRDPTRPDWYAGPPPRRTPGPVIETYADTYAIEFDCENCGVAPGDYCKQPDGSLRKMPCQKRIRAAARAAAALTEGSTDG